ncbi:MAG: PH domain-containing protein [Acidimicrobiales bacterium]
MGAPPPTRAPVALHQPSRTSPLTVALELAGLVTLGAAVALAVVAGAGLEVAQLALGALAIGARVVGWWFRTYTVTEGELVLDEGVLQKRHRVVPFSRIQQVELRQQLFARLFGITVVQIETAAESGSTAVSLRSLEVTQAEALRDHLLAEQRRVRRGEAHRPTDPGTAWEADRLTAPRRSLVQLTPLQLLAAGATGSGAVGATTAVVGGSAVLATIVGVARDWNPLLTFALFGAVAIGASVALAVSSALSSMVHWWDYELVVSGDDLHLSHGLLDRRQHTMPRHRLQHARVTDNPLRRALGFVSLDLHSAASPGGGGQQQGHVTIPLVRRAVLADLLADAMGADRWRPPELAPRPHVARRRAVVRRTGLLAALVVPLAVVGWPAGAGMLPLALLGVPWGRLAHRRAGSALDGEVLALAAGAVVHHLDLIPGERLQSARTSASPLQRRAQLATLHLDVAGGSRFGTAPRLFDLGELVAAGARRRPPSRP